MDNIIKKLRGNKTQKEFAELIGITQAAVSRYEKGFPPKREVLEKIAAVTGHRVVVTIEKIEEQGETKC